MLAGRIRARWSSTLTCASLRRLAAEMDARVVGQSDIKRALLLGLAASEHVYIEGPPGVAKTYLAEIAGRCVYHAERNAEPVEDIAFEST